MDDSEIPEDILEIARELRWSEDATAIARALMAERDRAYRASADLLREELVNYNVQRAHRGEIPSVQISILADTGRDKFLDALRSG